MEAINPVCGDWLRLAILWADDHAEQCAFRVRGCTAALAAGSALTELVLGKTRQEIAALTELDIRNKLGGLPPASGHVSALCMDALRQTLKATL